MKKRAGTFGYSLSMLDLLFGTFGAVVVLAFVLAAMRRKDESGSWDRKAALFLRIDEPVPAGMEAEVGVCLVGGESQRTWILRRDIEELHAAGCETAWLVKSTEDGRIKGVVAVYGELPPLREIGLFIRELTPKNDGGKSMDAMTSSSKAFGANGRALVPYPTPPVPWRAVWQSCSSMDDESSLQIENITTHKLKVPEGFRAAEGTAAEPYTNTGWAKEIIHEETGIKMVYIPEGRYWRGSTKDEQDAAVAIAMREYKSWDTVIAKRLHESLNDENPRHKVTLTKGFYMGTYEVTQGQWRKKMGTNPSYFNKVGDNGPVEGVSWSDCQAFIKKLNDATPSGADERFRMPTEAEWEYACRAGTTGDFAGNLADMGWYAVNSEKRTHEVGTKKPNAWGLYDMHGNVGEWCHDWYGDYPTGPVTDSTGPDSSLPPETIVVNELVFFEDRRWRVIRGGNIFCPAISCRSANRGSCNERGEFDAAIGFRLVKTVP